jgi:hypothetical protein
MKMLNRQILLYPIVLLGSASTFATQTTLQEPVYHDTRTSKTRLLDSSSSTSVAGDGDRDTLILIYESLCKEGAALGTIMNKLKSNDQIQDWQVSSVQTLWDIHSNHMSKHLDITEGFLLPRLKKYVSTIPEQTILDSHKILRIHLSTIEESVRTLDNSANGGGRSLSLATVMDNYNDDLQAHFVRKTDTLLWQAKSSMTRFQWARTMQNYMEKGGVEMGSFIHFMGVDTFRDEWMSFCKLPRFLWGVHFKTNWEMFQDKWGRHVSALELGVPPAL